MGELTESEVKRTMLDFSEVDPTSMESVKRYGRRCEIAGMLWQRYMERLKDRKNV